jgi:hypothetical protein
MDRDPELGEPVPARLPEPSAEARDDLVMALDCACWYGGQIEKTRDKDVWEEKYIAFRTLVKEDKDVPTPSGFTRLPVPSAEGALRARIVELEREVATPVLVATNRLADSLADARAEVAALREALENVLRTHELCLCAACNNARALCARGGRNEQT